MGFVPQDDVLHADLTVEEVLLFSARYRLPASATCADHRRHVEGALEVRRTTAHQQAPAHLGFRACAVGVASAASEK